MSLDKTNFNVGMQPGRRGKAPVLHSYTTTDAIATVMADGYFDEIGNMFTTNDKVYVVASDGKFTLNLTVSDADVTPEIVSTDMETHAKSSADAALAFGQNNLNSTLNQAYTLPTPVAGAEVEFTLKTGSSGSTVIDNSSLVTIGASGATITMVAGDTVRLRGASSTRWEIVANNGEAALS